MPHHRDPFAARMATPGRHPHRRPARGVALVGALIFGAAPAAAETDCFAADATAAGRWAEAVPLLEARLADPICADQTGRVRYSLAYATEKLAEAEPARACAAAEHYAAIEVDDAAITAAVAAGRARMDEACRLVREGGEEPGGGGSTVPGGQDPVAPVADRTAAIGLTVGAGLAAVAGGTLLYFGVQAEGERADAEAAMRAAHTNGHQVNRDRAEAELNDAADRAAVLGLSGWGALAVAAGLGVAATWAWVDDGPVLSVGAGQVGISGRF